MIKVLTCFYILMASSYANANACEDLFSSLSVEDAAIAEFFTETPLNYIDLFFGERSLFHMGMEGKLKKDDRIHVKYNEYSEFVIFQEANHTDKSTTYRAVGTDARVTLVAYDLNHKTHKEIKAIKAEHDYMIKISQYLKEHKIPVVDIFEEIERNHKIFVIEYYEHGNTLRQLEMEMIEKKITKEQYKTARNSFNEFKENIRVVEQTKEFQEYKEAKSIKRNIRVDEDSAIFQDGIWILTNP